MTDLWTSANDRFGNWLSELSKLLHHTDLVLGPYYLFMHVWVSLFGDSVLSLRMPSLLAMSVAAAFVALIGQKIRGPRVGLFSGIVFALIPAVSRLAAEARPYAFVMFSVALATWLLLRALENPTWKNWIYYGLAILLIALGHVVALVILSGHVFVVLLSSGDRRQHIARFVAAIAGGLFCAAPLLYFSHQQVKLQISWIPNATKNDLLAIWPQITLSAITFGIVLGLAAVTWSQGGRHAWWLSAMGIAPVLMVWSLSQGSDSYLLGKYLLFVLIAWAIIAGIALASVRLPIAFLILTIIVALTES